ncbi:MAG: hypothetical protein AB7F86_11875 [Bdellovibrionales bacterium]
MSDFKTCGRLHINSCKGASLAIPKQLNMFEMKNLKSLFIPERGRRKTQRPLSRRHPLHLILKSKRHDLQKNERAIHQKWHRLGKRLGLKTYRLVVVSDHVHAVVVIQAIENS